MCNGLLAQPELPEVVPERVPLLLDPAPEGRVEVVVHGGVDVVQRSHNIWLMRCGHTQYLVDAVWKWVLKFIVRWRMVLKGQIIGQTLLQIDAVSLVSGIDFGQSKGMVVGSLKKCD